jgi:hypothetical protein
VLKRKTSSKKFTLALTNTYDWIKQNRHIKFKELIKQLNLKLRGHYNYYGISFNSKGIECYYYQVVRILHKWLNCRGGKSVWNWDRINKFILNKELLLKPKIYHGYLSAKPN